ncbi:hypothetical protein [Lacinutrix jangbogonensis]|uniref:hypothetical protein n=1 Tax=Lacinutrix jangbogonensis TaxID=1469557 RepID=UPI00053EC8CF|nr:hypothetical protein [Lacinutrix jangbogonensis]
MKLKFLLVVVLLTTILGCTKNKYNLTEADKVFLNKTVDSIYQLDQNVRLHFNTIDKKFGVNKNTFSKSEGFKRQYLDALTYPIYQKSVDSIWSVLEVNDSLNTKLLIDLTNDYGFPNNRRLGAPKSKAYIVFTYTPKAYFTEVEALVNTEHKAGRIIEFKKEYILWHIRGRKGLPPMSSTKGEAIWQKPLDRKNK